MMITSKHQTPTGQAIETFKVGSKLVSVTELHDGQYRVACFIDYGVDGRSFCEGGVYKTRKGAQRRVAKFTGTTTTEEA